MVTNNSYLTLNIFVASLCPLYSTIKAILNSLNIDPREQMFSQKGQEETVRPLFQTKILRDLSRQSYCSSPAALGTARCKPLPLNRYNFVNFMNLSKSLYRHIFHNIYFEKKNFFFDFLKFLEQSTPLNTLFYFLKWKYTLYVILLGLQYLIVMFMHMKLHVQQ